jgi:hypothetical protein
MTKSWFAIIQRFEREKGWHYVAVPTELCKPLAHNADRGLIAITTQVGTSVWPPSLLPMGDGTHFIALPAKVRTKERLSLGDTAEVSFWPRTRARKPRSFGAT